MKVHWELQPGGVLLFNIFIAITDGNQGYWHNPDSHLRQVIFLLDLNDQSKRRLKAD